MCGRYADPNSKNSNAESKRPKAVSDGIVPTAPAWLSKDAKKIYKQAANEIVKLGVGGKCDANTLAIYAMQMSRLIAVSQMEKRELSHEKLLNELTASTLSLAKELGLSPSARAKMRVAKVEESSEVEDLFNDDEP